MGHTKSIDPQTDAAAPTPDDARTTDAGRSDTPKAEYLVPATGPCPELADGYATFLPDGVERSVLLFMSAASTRYLEAIHARGGFGFLCNHGGGHSVPNDSQASAWQFMQDHPFGTSPSPYAAGLPTGFLDYCSLDDL